MQTKNQIIMNKEILLLQSKIDDLTEKFDALKEREGILFDKFEMLNFQLNNKSEYEVGFENDKILITKIE